MKKDEIKLCGLAAVRAQFAANPDAVRCLYFDAATQPKIGSLCYLLAQSRRAYQCVESARLEKIAGSVHHGGIVAVITSPPLRTPAAAELRRWARAHLPLLVLDRIGNAHNLGALARTAAFFGVPHLVLAEASEAARPGAAAYRVAEGGLAHVTVWITRDLATFARELTLAGYAVVGAATRGGRLETPSQDPRPVALILGNEEQGLSPPVAAACTRLVTLPGSGQVESLNVSVAGAVLLWELVARHAASRRPLHPDPHASKPAPHRALG